MSVSVDIRTITKPAVLAVPIQAVTTRIDTTLAGETTTGNEVRTLVSLPTGHMLLPEMLKPAFRIIVISK